MKEHLFMRFPHILNRTMVLADDYGRETTMEGFEYSYFEAVDDLSPDFSLFLYIRRLNPGIYRVRSGIG
uniref:Bm267 n=1 Tax=Brugia malayi TaxID=6279 RepID=A0A0H5S300_BRUMA|nr:Bm267 [Brugia malayi]